MTPEILNRRARVQDVRLPDDPSKNLADLLKEIMEKLPNIRKPEDADLEFFSLIFKLLFKLGIHGTVFQTGRLTFKDEDGNEATRTFIFSGAYELDKGQEVYYEDLRTGKFDAVVIGRVGALPCDDSENEESSMPAA